MEIRTLVWNQKNIEHISRHNVEPEEAEEVCLNKPLILTAPSQGKNPVYYVLGQTQAGRHLFTVVIYFGNKKGYAVTSRDMTTRENRRYRAWKQ